MLDQSRRKLTLLSCEMFDGSLLLRRDVFQQYTWSRVILPSTKVVVHYLAPPFAYPNCFSDFPCELISFSVKYLSLSQSMTWFFCAMWSVMAALLSSEIDQFLWVTVYFLLAVFSAPFWCSFNRVPKALSVSPIYDFSHPLQSMYQMMTKAKQCRFISRFV